MILINFIKKYILDIGLKNIVISKYQLKTTFIYIYKIFLFNKQAQHTVKKCHICQQSVKTLIPILYVEYVSIFKNLKCLRQSSCTNCTFIQ